MDFQPGDCLLYRGTSLMSRLIQIKTWSVISHVEIACGPLCSVASRDGKGVDLYSIRTDGLYAMLRPVAPVNMETAFNWFYATARGQRYDWLGLFRFFTVGQQSMDKQFCSEFAVRFYRAGGFAPFAADYDADLVSPGMFLCSTQFRRLPL